MFGWGKKEKKYDPDKECYFCHEKLSKGNDIIKTEYVREMVKLEKYGEVPVRALITSENGEVVGIRDLAELGDYYDSIHRYHTKCYDQKTGNNTAVFDD